MDEHTQKPQAHSGPTTSRRSVLKTGAAGLGASVTGFGLLSTPAAAEYPDPPSGGDYLDKHNVSIADYDFDNFHYDYRGTIDSSLTYRGSCWTGDIDDTWWDWEHVFYLTSSFVIGKRDKNADPTDDWIVIENFNDDGIWRYDMLIEVDSPGDMAVSVLRPAEMNNPDNEVSEVGITPAPIDDRDEDPDGAWDRVENAAEQAIQEVVEAASRTVDVAFSAGRVLDELIPSSGTGADYSGYDEVFGWTYDNQDVSACHTFHSFSVRTENSNEVDFDVSFDATTGVGSIINFNHLSDSGPSLSIEAEDACE